jgi:putative tricarboxylic transport membrane protein
VKKIIAGQMGLAVGVLAIGVFFLVGSFLIPDAAGYSTVGPREVPRIVGSGLILLSLMLAWEVWRGGFRNHDEAAEAALTTDWRAFAWLSAGILLYGLVIESVGFIFASVVLFVCTARAFASKRWLSNVVIALVLAVLVFALFNYGLGLNLPKGFLKEIL